MADPGTVPRVLLDRYELRERAGVGGMGEVWMGWDRRLQRDVAVKLLLPQLSDEPSFRERFGIEARAAAALDHPNVVRVFDVDEDAGTLFIVMERLPGPSLDRRIAEDGPLSEEDVRRVAADLLAALSAAHAEKLVHRDIKPGNLIRAAGGRWKVGDFGVAKDLASTAHLTLVGVAVGTPAYLAPEQLDGRPATPATDLWAAAVVLREALTGRRPFEGNDPIEVAHAVQSTVVPPLATVRPDVAPALAAALDRALSFDPRNRFPTAQAMADAIEGRTADALVAPSDVPAPPPSVSGEVPATPTAGDDAPAAGGAAGDDGDGSTARTVGMAAIAIGAILVLFLLGLLFGLAVMGGDDDGPDGDAPQQDEPATTPSPAAEGPDGTKPPTAPTSEPGLLPGDGPVDTSASESGPTTEEEGASAPDASPSPGSVQTTPADRSEGPEETAPPTTGGAEGEAPPPPAGGAGLGPTTAPESGLDDGSFG